MYTIVSGQLAVYKQIELIANNLANINTTGYKSERALFEKALDKQAFLLGSSLHKDIEAPNALPTESFVGIRGSFTDHTQGPIEITNNPLDVAISGKGFFVINTADGEKYTRAGNFRLDTQNRLVTQSGDPVMGSGGEITLKGTEIVVAADGNITVDKQPAGKLRLVELTQGSFLRDQKLLFKLDEGASVNDVLNPQVQAGALEGSNVNAVQELAQMILSSRLYEGFKNAQDHESQMSAQRNQVLGSVG